MSHNHIDAIATKLAKDVDSNRMVDGSMLLRHELECHPQQALAVIKQEMDREQQNGSTRRLEVNEKGELFLTDFKPASGIRSEGYYVGMYPGGAEQQVAQPHPMAQAEVPLQAVPPPAPPRYEPQAESPPPPPSVDYGTAPETSYFALPPRYATPPRPFYPDEQPSNGFSPVAAETIGVLGGLALDLVLGGRGRGVHGNYYDDRGQQQRRYQQYYARQRQQPIYVEPVYPQYDDSY